MGPHQREHVRRCWFERIAKQPTDGSSSYLEHELVVETHLLSDLDIIDSGQLADLEDELRKTFNHAGDIRFVPLRE